MKLTLAGLVLGVACAYAQTPSAQTPSTPAPTTTVTPPPVAPAPPAVNLDAFHVNDDLTAGAFYWMAGGFTELNGGKKSPNPPAASLRLLDFDRKGKGVMFTLPAGKYNNLEIEAFDLAGGGGTTATAALSLFGTSIPQGDVLATSTRLRGGKISWNYLTYPSPPESSWFRLKTLWEVHLLQISGTADDVTASNAGASLTAQGTKLVVLPAVGLGVELAPSKHFHFELKTSGMGLPHRSRVLDVEALAVIRVRKVEALLGGKGLDFRSNPGSDEFFRVRTYGPFGGVRWVF